MDKGLHFITGLPRSGSTLLSALLKQNPKFQAGVTTPMALLFGNLQTAMSGRNEFHSFIDNDTRRRVLSSMFSAYYTGIHEDKVVFDTNRSWSSRIPALLEIFPAAKFIFCVRAVGDIVNSLENITQKNSLEPSRIFNYAASGTIYDRVNDLIKPTGMVGHAYNGLKQAFYGKFTENIVLLPYKSLASDPRKSLQGIYDFIGEQYFEHDFDNVSFNSDAYDKHLGLPGLHSVRPQVTLAESKLIVPPDLLARFSGSEFWNVEEANTRSVRVL